MSPADQLQREIAARWILLDLARWRAERDRRTCDALWNLPTQQTRKETGQ